MYVRIGSSNIKENKLPCIMYFHYIYHITTQECLVPYKITCFLFQTTTNW